MKILMLAQFYPPVAGGEERHVEALAAALGARGHVVDVLTTATPSQGPGAISTAAGVRVHRVATTAQRLRVLHSDPERPHSPPLPDPAMARAVGAMLETGQYDIVHGHDWVVRSALGPAQRAATPVVLTLHDYGEVCSTKRLVLNGAACPGPSVRRCVPCTTRHYGWTGPGIAAANALGTAHRRRAIGEFLPVSSAVAEASGLKRAGVDYTVVPNFVPDSLVLTSAPTDGPPPGAPIVFAGDLTRDKGVGVLLDAFRRLARPPELVLAGRTVPGQSLDFPRGARAIGLVDHETVTELMRGALLVAVPSIYPDPCPTVVLEAMAAARPVVASATGGIVDLVAGGETGLLVPPGDAASLARALEELLGDDIRASAQGRAGLARVRGFTVSAVVGMVEAAYERAVQRGARRWR